jgi:hypothetical protein
MEKTLKLTEVEAKEMYETAPSAIKKLLESNFGKKTFIVNITDRIKTIDDILEYHGKTMAEFNSEMKGRSKRAIAYELLELGIAAMNEGWIPNWRDYNECKYYPWFDMDADTGFGFSATFCDSSHSITAVGSRLYFKSRELASYFANQFLYIYKDFMTY